MSTVADHSSGEQRTAGSHPALETGLSSLVRTPPAYSLLPVLETVAVAGGTIAAIKAVTIPGYAGRSLWLVVPAAMVAAALLPTWIAGRSFPRIGLDRAGIRVALTSVCCACVCVLPALFLGLWLLKSLRLPIPLQPAVGGPRNCVAWSLYQFLYVAVAEEVFFRGYIQANAARVLDRAGWLPPTGRQWVTILVSAACFALAHVVIQNRATSAVTFLPGVLLAWLFARTHTLLAPILFHGVANVAYGIVAEVIPA